MDVEVAAVGRNVLGRRSRLLLGVVGLDHQDVLAVRAKRLCRIVPKGGEATSVPAQVPAVEPDIGYQADGSKLEPVFLAGDARRLFEDQAIVARAAFHRALDRLPILRVEAVGNDDGVPLAVIEADRDDLIFGDLGIEPELPAVARQHDDWTHRGGISGCRNRGKGDQRVDAEQDAECHPGPTLHRKASSLNRTAFEVREGL